MAVSDAIVTTEMDAAGWWGRDNKARELINRATAVELKSLNAKSVLRLYGTMHAKMSVITPVDHAATKRLQDHTKFQPVTPTIADAARAVANGGGVHPIAKALIDGPLISRIIAAEAKRMNWYEMGPRDPTSTKGRGQIGEPSYQRVRKGFPGDFKRFMEPFAVAKAIRGEYPGLIDWDKWEVMVPDTYAFYWYTPLYNIYELDNFVIAAVVAVNISDSAKTGRNQKDTLRYAMVRYHGMFKMVSGVQRELGFPVDWPPVEAKLLAGSPAEKDAADYVNEIVI